MKASKEIKKKKVIADLLDKKFNQLDKLIGGTAVGCQNGQGEQKYEWPAKCLIAG